MPKVKTNNIGNNPKNKNTLLVVLSDMHSGSSQALFVNRFWKGKNQRNHTSTSRQDGIYKQFQKFGAYIMEARKDKRVILVHDGDAVEGWHHGSKEIITPDPKEQSDIHVELMSIFQSMIGWQRGDQLYYVNGTESHTADVEEDIAKEMNAQQAPDDAYVFNHLELVINGQSCWFVHHGPGSGKGANEGNTVRNWLRDIYWDSVKELKMYPSIVFSGHVHTPTYNSYVVYNGGSYVTLHGVICPSWQYKTRYAYKVAPVQRNKIGGVSVEIRDDGEIKMPVFNLIESDSIGKVVI